MKSRIVVGLVLGAIIIGGECSRLDAQETIPVGKTKEAQERNAELLRGYDYDECGDVLAGYIGQDRQRVTFVHSLGRCYQDSRWPALQLLCPDGTSAQWQICDGSVPGHK